jgi:hypothetical protein
VVTFNNILKHRAIPLAKTLERILEITRSGLGCSVEVEFAVEMGDWGKRISRGQQRQSPELYLLQVRPLVSRTSLSEFSQIKFDRDQILCSSQGSLGHGLSREVRDIVYVDGRRWHASRNRKIARELADLNGVLESEGRPFLLIGPGRWGSADEWLGIPVKWMQISGARVIVEASPEGYNVDPSQGTHFFHNITAHGIGYLALPPGAEKTDASELFMDWDWLDSQEAYGKTDHLRHLRLDGCLTVLLDGREGRGIIAKPS